jgi:hypothetical protein
VNITPEKYKKLRQKDTKAVEAALLKRAVGYRAREIYLAPADPEISADSSASDYSEKIVKITEKDVAPNIQACLAWLKAYSPDIWGKTASAEDDGDISMLFSALTGSSRTEDDEREYI